MAEEFCVPILTFTQMRLYIFDAVLSFYEQCTIQLRNLHKHIILYSLQHLLEKHL